MQTRDHVPAAVERAFIFLLITSILLGPISCTSGKSKQDASRKQKTTVSDSNAPVNFVLVENRIVVDDKVAQSRAPEIETTKQTENKKIVQLIQDYYESAFLNPDFWDDGKFSKVESFFAPGIRDRVRKEDFESLCLSEASNDIDYLKEVDAKITELSISLDKNAKPRLSVATVEVSAKFIQKDRKPADYESSALLFLEPDDNNGWRIFDYNLKYKLESEGNAR